MSRRLKKAKPKSPELIAEEKRARLAAQRAQDFAAVGLQPDASTLAANADIVVTRKGPKTLDAVRRQDVFDLLRDGMETGAYDAVRRLERDMRVRRGENDRGSPVSRVDNGADRERFDNALAAGERVDRALGRIGERDAWLLGELIYPIMPGQRTWRETVEFITAETNPHAQAAAVRSACANLRRAYEIAEGRATPIQSFAPDLNAR